MLTTSPAASLYRAFAAVLLLTGATACAPTREAIEEQTAEAAAEQISETPETFRTEADFGEVQVGWIETFNDPLLIKLVAEAQRNNKSLAAAATNVERSRQLARQAGAALLPNAGLSAGTQETSASDGSASLNLGVNVSWELDLWGKIRTGKWAAEANQQAAEADFKYSQYSLAASTAKAYFAAIEANLQIKIEKETTELLEETLRITEAKYHAGSSSSQDLALAKSDLASARDRLVTAEGAYRNALRALELLLGRYPAADIDVASALPESPPPPPVGLPAELLERRPDMIAAERRVAAAFNAEEQARVAKLPSISLTAAFGGASSALGSVLSGANQTWSLGSSLLSPLFDGGILQSQEEIAGADKEQALALYGDAALKAFGEMESTLDLGGVIVERQAQLQIAATESQEAYRVAKLNYDVGETDLLSVLTIQQRVISAKRGLQSVQRLLLDQRVDLHLALGGGW